MSTHQCLVEDCLKKDLINLFAGDFVLFAEFECLGKEIPDQLHEFVDTMVVNQVPFLVEMHQHCLQEEQCIFSWQFDQQLGDASAEIVLVDHLVEVPQAEE